MGRRADGRGTSGGATVAARLGLASIGSRPPAVAVLVVALVVVGTIVASVVGTLSLARGSGGDPAPSDLAAPPLASTPTAVATAPATAPPPTMAPTAAPPPTPSDPRDAFQDPELRTLAAPFLAGPAVSCQPREPVADVAESVTCDLGEGRTALFSRLQSPEVMRDQRRGIVAGQDAQPGTVLSVRWRYGARQEATRAGIPPGETDRGEGVRVRFVDREGVPRLYFDQDSSGCTGDLALTRPTGNDDADLEALRTYWADPAG